MKIAVTGASGFVGRHVLAELGERDLDIVAVDRDVKHLANCGFAGRIVEMDVASATETSFEELGQPDVLIHLAWAGLPYYESLHHFETELPCHYRFIKTMVLAGLSSLVATGTCFEYGFQSGPLSENLPTMPNNPYGYAKDALRRQLQFLQSAHPFSFTWARLFYMYGDGQPPTALYSQLKQAVMEGSRSFDMSGGEQLRDYLPVREVARYLVAIALGRVNMGATNVCSGKPISIRKLVEGWLTENSWEIDLNLEHYPYSEYEPLAFWGDRRKLDAILQSL